ncbi:MAG: DUF6249 domain-containing protein [Gammaproteobacteria bacterium]|nr:DUF6249 domain-containing protein [Gammaproteobacteria bacterium]MDH3767883.1 DUF6249 domain-containing protein [Gammaproteobacteria bacterium]
MDEFWIPIVMFVSIAAVLGLWLYFRFRTRSALQLTVRTAIEKGQDLSPELLDRLGQPKSSAYADLRRGVISIGLGAAFAIFAFVLDEQDAVRPLLAVSAFPFAVGVAYLALWMFGGKDDS